MTNKVRLLIACLFYQRRIRDRSTASCAGNDLRLNYSLLCWVAANHTDPSGSANARDGNSETEGLRVREQSVTNQAAVLSYINRAASDSQSDNLNTGTKKRLLDYDAK